MNFKAGEIYTNGTDVIRVISVDENEPCIHWQWHDWSEESLPTSTVNFNSLIEMYRMTKETTKEKIARLGRELVKAQAALEQEEMLEKIKEMNKTMTIGQLRVFRDVLTIYFQGE